MLRNLGTLVVSAMVSAALAFPSVASAMSPRDIYKKNGKAVVLVFATDGSAQGSAGTGSIITEDGQIITNAHVVSKEGKPYKKLFVYLKPDKLVGSMQDDLKQRFEAQLLDIDPNLDLALLKMKSPPGSLPVIQFADPDGVEPGDPVVAIGHPETGGLWTLTTGVVSTVVKDFQGIKGKDVFQTEASINRGNSGGPLLNEHGQMVGINTCISRRAADGLAITSINFSLKSSVPVEWLKRKDLLALAYAKPADTGDGSSGAIAMAEKTKPSDRPAIAEKVAEKQPAQKETIVKEKTEKGGETIIAVVEPDKGEDVAEDPGFAQEAQASSNVSSARDLPGGAKVQKEKPKAVPQAKILTKARPYNLDGFVNDRVKEIKALEQDMDMMRDEIERRKKGGKTTRGKSNGMGLW